MDAVRERLQSTSTNINVRDKVLEREVYREENSSRLQCLVARHLDLGSAVGLVDVRNLQGRGATITQGCKCGCKRGQETLEARMVRRLSREEPCLRI